MELLVDGDTIMSQLKTKRERLWQVEARITLPRFMQMKKDGSFPSPLRLYHIYPELLMYKQDGLEIWLRCDSPESIVSVNDFPPGSLRVCQITTGQEDKSGQDLGFLHPEQHPYKLIAKIFSDKPENAVDNVIAKIDLQTDILSFQLQYPVKIIQLIVTDASNGLQNGEKRECIVFSSTPYYRIAKDAVALYNDPIFMSIDPDQIEKDLPEHVEAGLRWFIKGLSAFPVVDKFTFFWISLEILIPHLVPSEKAFFQCRKCGFEILECPQCDSTTKHRPLLRQKMKLYIQALDRKPELFDQLWQTRQMFHGRVRLKNFEEIENIAELVSELKSIVVDALKLEIGIPEIEPPYSPVSGFHWSTLWLRGFQDVES